MIQVVNDSPTGPRIVVVGVGGAGCNAVDSMYESQLGGVQFIAVNTDQQALSRTKTEDRLHIGDTVTAGLGTGANPDRGKECAEADRDKIRDALQGADLVFLTAGLGGGTGTGATSVIAEIAKHELNALTVAIVTKPFEFEGPIRALHADQGQQELRNMVDTLITVPNEKLLKVVDEHTSLVDAFAVSNRVLMQCVQSISDLITQPGLINLDFAAIRAIMNDKGGAVMGVGFGKGPDKAEEAFQQASSSPLMEEVVIRGARGILIHVTAGPDLTLHEINNAINEHVTKQADEDANILFGVVEDEKLQDEMHVTILATGFSAAAREANQRITAAEATPQRVEEARDFAIPAFMRSARRYDEEEIETETEEAYDEPAYAAVDEPAPARSTADLETEERDNYERVLRRPRREKEDMPPSIFGGLL